MFETLQKGLTEALRKLRRSGRLTESNIRDGLQEVRRALLEADVHYQVVNDFIRRVTEKAVGQQVIRSINPSEQIVKIVYDELVALMGPVDADIHWSSKGPTVIMLCGLQGSGKTTTCGKLALFLRRHRNKRPLLVAADLQRPAAVEQLQTLGEQIGVPVYVESNATPVQVCRNAVAAADELRVDTIILDTAGRLHVDEELMRELSDIDRLVQPNEVLLVVDAMTGQVAVEVARAFNEALELDGLIMTKLDGDARGGAALSVKAVTGVPIKFVGVGEKLDRLELFRPERMASRILGAGDLMTLVEKVAEMQRMQDEEELRRQQERLAKGEISLEDFRRALSQMEKMGSLQEILQLIPGGSQLVGELDVEDTKELRRLRGIIDSMTPEERRNPAIIDGSRRRRIAAGSGTDPSEVGQLLKAFNGMRPMLKQMAQMSLASRLKALAGLGTNPGVLAGLLRGGRGKRELVPTKSYQQRMEERRAKKRKKRKEKRKRRR